MLTWFSRFFRTSLPLADSQGSCETLCESAVFWKKKAEEWEKRYLAEVRTNRRREDEFTNRVLTASGVYGVKNREEILPAVSPSPPPDTPLQPSLLPANYDEERELEIRQRVDELEINYANRGKKVSRELIDRLVRENADYYLNSEEVEFEGMTQ